MSTYVFNRNGGSADEFGHLLALSRLLGSGGVIEGHAVTQAASPNMSVLVANGSAAIATGTYPDSYSYFVGNDTSGGVSVTITTAPTSNSRIDSIVAYVDKSVTASTSSPNNPNAMLKYAAVAGTVAGSPVPPNSTAIQTAIGAANPYIVLANVTVGTSVTSIVNSNIADVRPWARVSQVNVTNPYAFKVWQNANVSMTASAFTKIPFTTKKYDISTNYDMVTNFRFNAPIAGVYQFNARAGSSASATRFITSLYVNGAEKTRGTDITGGASTPVGSVVADAMQLNAGDYVEVYGFCSASGSVLDFGEMQCNFSGFLVRPT